jgi:myo-inositol-1(or 4)-monophosphatase
MADAFPTAAEDLELLRSSAVTAGIIASGYFRKDVKTWTKGIDSPVSEADIVVDKYLRAALETARPGYGWLSEESADDLARFDAKRVFVVDPIDGTRGFIKGEDSWCVCLAVVEDGAATAGVVYAPVRDEMYEASVGGGARLNGSPLIRRRPPERRAPVIPAPGAVHHELQEAGLDYSRGGYYPSLAYRLVQVATGRLDAAVARRGSHDWDIAAAAVILSEAGVELQDVCQEAVRFNKTDVRHGALAAFAELSLKPVLHDALRRVYGCPEVNTRPIDLERKAP